ncbi:hypothetical protein [Oceanobacillus damuensis]|uniref:hypothetical protein n=1 Tax=Oceanobacillus damuensis TaxID=937928 RepID=UPI00083358BF|nr:hypothetical protein [Oceanobacillus damuensis]
MEQETVLKEVLNAFKLHANHIDEKMDTMRSDLESKMDNMKSELETKMDKGFAEVNQKIDHLGKKVDGLRVELTETQETVDFSASKVVQHEKKLRQLNMQQN